jgi:CelD/BcsL family acetyltransferase involved in cellulose biosynthesis
MNYIEDFRDAAQWDAYVENHPQARFCHLFGYRCLESVYGYTPRYSAFLKNDRIVGVLPAFEVKSMLFGRRLVSQPFSEYGGLLLDEDLRQEDVEEIIHYLRASTAGARSLEMHGRLGIGPHDCEQYLLKSNAQWYAYLPLDVSIDQMWSKVITYQVRKAVQKAQRSGLTVVERSDPETLVRDFYPFYLLSMKRLGVPPHSVQYYLRCQAAYGDRMKIFWAMRDGAPLAGLLGFSCGKRVNIINIVSDERAWEVRPNDLVHWEYIKWAHAAGYQFFDFGSIRYDGQLHFKRKWGCTIEDHGYYFLKKENSSEEMATFNSSSTMMKRFSSIWSRFVPQPIGSVVGPVLRKHLIR